MGEQYNNSNRTHNLTHKTTHENDLKLFTKKICFCSKLKYMDAKPEIRKNSKAYMDR